MIQQLDDDKTLDEVAEGFCLKCHEKQLTRGVCLPRDGRELERRVTCVLCLAERKEVYCLEYVEVKR